MGIAADEYKVHVHILPNGGFSFDSQSRQLKHYKQAYRSNSGKTTRPAKHTTYAKITDALDLSNYDNIYNAIKTGATEAQWAVVEPKLTAWKDMWF